MSGVDAVLLVAFGGPTAPHEIRPFLEIVTRGRGIPAERLEEVAHHYEAMPGGRSPLAELTFAQARATLPTRHGGLTTRRGVPAQVRTGKGARACGPYAPRQSWRRRHATRPANPSATSSEVVGSGIGVVE